MTEENVIGVLFMLGILSTLGLRSYLPHHLGDDVEYWADNADA